MCVFIIGCGLLMLLWLLRTFVLTFEAVLWPLAVASILALLLRPIAVPLQQKFKLGPTGGTLLLYVLIFVVLATLTVFVLPVLIGQAIEFIQFQAVFLKDMFKQLKTQYPGALAYLQEHVREADLKNVMQQTLSGLRGILEAGMPVVKRAGETMGQALAWVSGMAIIPVYLFFFLSNQRNYREDLEHQLSFIDSSFRKDLLFLGHEFVSILVAFFRGQILIALIMGILLAIGFTSVGLNFGILLGLFLGILNIIPFLGTIVGVLITVPVAFFQTPDGGITLVGLVLAVFTLVQLFESYFLTPKIMGNQTGLHPMAIIISIFFWGTALGGLMGMILAIPLTAFFIIVWRLLSTKYIPKLFGKNTE